MNHNGGPESAPPFMTERVACGATPPPCNALNGGRADDPAAALLRDEGRCADPTVPLPRHRGEQPRQEAAATLVLSRIRKRRSALASVPLWNETITAGPRPGLLHRHGQAEATITVPVDR